MNNAFSRPAAFAAACALIAGIGGIDYLTGYEVAIYPFYALPILWIAFRGDRPGALALCVLSVAAWWAADLASGHPYSREWLRVWEALVRLVFFGLVTFAGSAARLQRDAIQARIELLERSRQLEKEIVGISERERQGIGRDLHDGLCQFLAAIGLTADLLQQKLARENMPHADLAGEIRHLLRESVERTRELARGLSPVDRDAGGLESALEELASTTARLTGISCEFICPAPAPALDDLRAMHLFRIAQEAVGNALRHGRARAIVIALDPGEGEIALRVSDDGVGFDPARCVNRGLGLNIMRYRARMAGAQLDIYANSPAGSVVSCTVSLPITLP